MHCMWPRKIEEGDWVLVYDSSLHKQHWSMRKFARRWFGPYVVASTNDNTTYHLAELDVTRIEVPVAGKRIKFFKKRHKVEPDPEMEDKDSDKDGEPDEGRTDDNSEEDE